MPGQLVYCETGSSVVLTMVDGVVVSERGMFTKVNEADLLDEAREMFGGAERAGSRTARHLEPVYAEVVRRANAIDVGMTRWAGTI